MKYFKNKKNTFSIFLFQGVVERRNKGIRNYNSKHITKKSFIRKLNYCKIKDTKISWQKINIQLWLHY